MNSKDAGSVGEAIELRCPCCGAALKIDARLGRVIWHEAAKPKKSGRDHLDRVGDVLEKQAAQREAHFRESAEQEKLKSDVLARKFEEALKKTRDVPVKPGLRDIDLD
jgi:hypothetical protein